MKVLMRFKYLFALFFFLIALKGIAQKPLNKPIDRGPKSKIELISADSLIGISGITSLRTFYGNVKFLHRGVILSCQKAIHNSGDNKIQAYGRIKINQGDTLTITGDTLYYDGDTRFARIFGKKVLLTDDDVTVESTRMNYDLNIDEAFYPVRGTIRQDSAVLKSNSGFYNTRSKLFKYAGDVEIVHPDYVICTDSLDYDSNTGDAFFKTSTTINSKDGILMADKGYYNIRNKNAQFIGRSKVENEEYYLLADTLHFNNETEEGFGKGRVEFYSKKDSLFLNGEYGEKLKSAGYTKIRGNALMRLIGERDTLYLSADSILAFNDKSLAIRSLTNSISANPDSLNNTDSTAIRAVPIVDLADPLTILPDNLTLLQDSASKKDTEKMEFLIASGNVKIYRSDFQATCDSLNYDLVDSVITFIRKPEIWSKGSQMLADTVLAYMKNDRINKMDLIQKSFVISQDTAQNFNQIKGRQIQAFFDNDTAIKLIEVEGNGESIYFALDDQNKLIGLNRVVCSKMRLNFADKKVKRISFMGAPESKLIPPHEIDNEVIELENFSWDIDKKPSKKSVIGSNFDDISDVTKKNELVPKEPEKGFSTTEIDK